MKDAFDRSLAEQDLLDQFEWARSINVKPHLRNTSLVPFSQMSETDLWDRAKKILDMRKGISQDWLIKKEIMTKDDGRPAK